MPRTQALILAAGKGTRLGKSGEDLPKCLVQVGGQPIIEHQLETLSDMGVGPVTMVVGHGADLVREAVNGRSEYVFNARYASTNSLYSLWLARDQIKGPLLILNCDVVYHPDVLNRILEEGPDVLAYDSSSGLAREQTKVGLRDGFITGLSKTMPPDDSAGENLGIIYLSEKSVQVLLECADKLVKEDGGDNSWVIKAVEETAKKRRIRGVDVAGTPWVEIDFPYDLDRARREVWPKIQKPVRRKPLWPYLAVFGAVLLVAGILFRMQAHSYEDLPAEGGKSILLTDKGTPLEWELIAAGEKAEVQIQSDGEVRIDVRSILSTDARHPYVVAVYANDELVNWYKFKATPDPDAQYKDWIVADRDRIDVALDPGPYRLSVKLVAGPTDKLLVRFRRPEPQD